MKLTNEDGLAIGVVAGEAVIGGLIWRFGQAGPLPMHFGLRGEVDRWGDHTDVAVIVVAVALVTGALYLLLPVLALPRSAEAARARSIPIARLVLLLVSLCVSLLMAAIGFGLMGAGHSPLPLSAGFISLIMLALGLFLGKVEPNPFVGVHTYWSLRSRLAWDKSNRLFGRLSFWGGLAALILSPIAPEPLGFQIVIAALLAFGAIAVFESWRVWRDDPDRVGAAAPLR